MILGPIFEPLFERGLHDPDPFDLTALDRQIASQVGLIEQRLNARIAIAVRADDLRMHSYDYGFFLDGEHFGTCPESRGVRYPASWQCGDRALWNHCYQLAPTQSPRRFLERFTLPDHGANEWAADSPYAHMLNLPFVHAGESFGKLTVFTRDVRFDVATLARKTDDLMADLTPLWLYRHFLGDLARTAPLGPTSSEIVMEQTRETIARAVRTRVAFEGRLDSLLPPAEIQRLATLRAWQRAFRQSPGAHRPPLRALLGPADLIFHRGLAALLADPCQDRPPVEIVGFSAGLVDALACHRRLRPGVTILDGAHPAALELVHRLRRQDADSAILFVATRADDLLVAQLGEAGVNACVTKANLSVELGPALDALTRGRAFYGTGLRDLVGVRLGRPALSSAEIAVLRAARQGLTNVEIATACRISPDTVKLRLKKAFEKLDVTSRVAAVDRAVRAGLI